MELDDRGLILSCPSCGRPNRLAYERVGQPARCSECHTPLNLPGETIELENEVQFDALTMRAALPVLVDFWAPWCGPCKMVAPEVAKVAAEGVGRWLVAKLNTEALTAPAHRLHVTAIPLFVLFRGGHEIKRHAGAMPAAKLRLFVESAC